MLGENGAGKSSILQAVALTLLNDDANIPSVDPRQVLRKGSASGHVRVWFHASDVPRELQFRRGARRFIRKGPRYYGALLAFGATRLLPNNRSAPKPATVRVENLFDPFFPLMDASHWLGGLDGVRSISSRAHCATFLTCPATLRFAVCGRRAKRASH